MPVPDILEQLVSKLEETGLADLPGSLLYSSLGTVKPGEIYLLGFNPGGDPAKESASVTSQLRMTAKHSATWSAYTDEEWCPAGRRCEKGQAPMQKRVRKLVESLGLEPSNVCASNLIFARSQVAKHLSNGGQLAEQCWAVHRFILEIIRPKSIISIGGSLVFDFIVSKTRKPSQIEYFPSGHGAWRCSATQAQIDGQDMNLVSVPHVGRYAIDGHPEVLNWLYEKSGLSRR